MSLVGVWNYWRETTISASTVLQDSLRENDQLDANPNCSGTFGVLLYTPYFL
jgi:hypothetical protein